MNYLLAFINTVMMVEVSVVYVIISGALCTAVSLVAMVLEIKAQDCSGASYFNIVSCM